MSEHITKTVSFDAFKWIVGSLVVVVIALSGMVWANLINRVESQEQDVIDLEKKDRSREERFLILSTRLDARLFNIEQGLGIKTPESLRINPEALQKASTVSESLIR